MLKNKIKSIGLVLCGIVIAYSAYSAYDVYYKAIYAKGFKDGAIEAVELTNAYIDLVNTAVKLCKDNPDSCAEGVAIVGEKERLVIK